MGKDLKQMLLELRICQPLEPYRRTTEKNILLRLDITPLEYEYSEAVSGKRSKGIFWEAFTIGNEMYHFFDLGNGCFEKRKWILFEEIEIRTITFHMGSGKPAKGQCIFPNMAKNYEHIDEEIVKDVFKEECVPQPEYGGEDSPYFPR